MIIKIIEGEEEVAKNNIIARNRATKRKALDFKFSKVKVMYKFRGNLQISISMVSGSLFI